MSTSTAPAEAPQPFAIRRDLAFGAAGSDLVYGYELTDAVPNGVSMHVVESAQDAAIFLTPTQLVELRADLATMLIRLGHGVPRIGEGAVRSTAGVALVEVLRQAFLALIELDKDRPHEVDQIAALIVAHVRSWRPFALQEVTRG